MTGSAAPLDATQETLSTLSNAIVVAAEAWAAKVAAAEALATTEGAWRQARAALDIAYRAFGSEDVAPPAVDAVPAPIDPETLVDAHPRPRPKRQAPNGGDVKRAAKAEERAVLVLAALERHGGDTRAAGHELGIRGNIVAIIAKHARARAAAQA